MHLIVISHHQTGHSHGKLKHHHMMEMYQRAIHSSIHHPYNVHSHFKFGNRSSNGITSHQAFPLFRIDSPRYVYTAKTR